MTTNGHHPLDAPPWHEIAALPADALDLLHADDEAREPPPQPARRFDAGTATYRAATAAEAAGDGENPIPRRYSWEELTAQFPNLREPVVGNLLRLGEVMNVVAPPKRGKSWLVAQLIISVASGGEWLGRFATRRGNVLLVDNELYPELIRRRISEVAEAMGANEGLFAERLTVLPLRGNLLTVAQLDAALADIPEGEFVLAVIDARYRMQIERGADENDNAGTAQFYNSLDSLARRLGAGIVVVHHSSKGAQGEKSVVDVGAGGGSQARAADTHLVIRDHEEEGAVVLEAATRSFPPLEPIGLRWTWPLWQADDALDATALKGRKGESNARQNDSNRAAEEEIVGLLERDKAKFRSSKWIEDHVGFGATRARNAINRLLSAETIVERSGKVRGRARRLFRISEKGEA